MSKVVFRIRISTGNGVKWGIIIKENGRTVVTKENLSTGRPTERRLKSLRLVMKIKTFPKDHLIQILRYNPEIAGYIP
jgi:hypothetical protein